MGFSDLCLRSALSGWVIVNYPKSHSRPRSSGISQRRMDCSGSQADAGIRPCLHQSATPASPLTDPGQLAQRNPVPSHRRPGKTGLAVLVAQLNALFDVHAIKYRLDCCARERLLSANSAVTSRNFLTALQRQIGCGRNTRCTKQHCHDNNLVLSCNQGRNTRQNLPRHHPGQRDEAHRKQRVDDWD